MPARRPHPPAPAGRHPLLPALLPVFRAGESRGGAAAAADLTVPLGAGSIRVMSEDARSLGREVRGLLRAAATATLATALARDGSGHPYASLVLPAATPEGEPLLLLSDLADHSRNLAADPRASLLVGGAESLAREDPLAEARAVLLGRVEALGEGEAEVAARRRYLARHPTAAAYAAFGDFRVYRMSVERAHLVAGFGRVHWLEGEALAFDATGCAALIEAETEIVEHMNQDHGDALDLIAAERLGLPGGGWRMTGIDPEGLDLRRGAETARLSFEAPLADPAACRWLLVRLTQEARQAAALAKPRADD